MLDPVLIPKSGVTREELASRAACLGNHLKKANIPLAVVGYPPDLYYFTGSIQLGYALVTWEGETIYLVKKDPERARIESPLEKVIPYRRFSEIKDAVRGLFGKIPETFTLSLDVVPTNLFLRFKDVLDRARIEDDSAFIRSCRMIKSPYEVENIRQGIKIYDAVLRRVSDLLKEGMTEAEAEGALVFEMRRHGHQGLVRMRGWDQEGIDGYLYAGRSAAVPSFLDAPLGGAGMTPAVAIAGGNHRIGRNEPIVFDASPGVNGYVSDQTRTMVFGQLSEKLENAYRVAVEMVQRFEAEAKPGDLCGDWFDTMEKMAARAGLRDHFMGFEDKRARFVGHGIGLELNEWPVLGKGLTWRLDPGMVVAVEPKMVFPEAGVVGIENDYLITETGVARLSVTDDALIVL